MKNSKFFKRPLLLSVFLLILILGSKALDKWKISMSALGAYVEFTGAWLDEVRRVEKQGKLTVLTHKHATDHPHIFELYLLSKHEDVLENLAAKLASPCTPQIPSQPNCLKVERHAFIYSIRIYQYPEWDAPCINYWEVFPRTWKIKKHESCSKDWRK